MKYFLFLFLFRLVHSIFPTTMAVQCLVSGQKRSKKMKKKNQRNWNGMFSCFHKASVKSFILYCTCRSHFFFQILESCYFLRHFFSLEIPNCKLFHLKCTKTMAIHTYTIMDTCELLTHSSPFYFHQHRKLVVLYFLI